MFRAFLLYFAMASKEVLRAVFLILALYQILKFWYQDNPIVDSHFSH